jgi:tetratricopeptide (TPR) repeat protein
VNSAFLTEISIREVTDLNNTPFIIAGVCLAVAIYLGYRLLRSPVWKQRQLQKASKLAALGKVKEMIDYLEVNRNKKNVSCPLTNALIFYFIRSGEIDRAEKLVIDAMGAGDQSGIAIAQMGYIAQIRGDNDNAEKFYRQAMLKEPKLEGTMKVNLAGLFINMNEKLDEAEVLLEEALDQREGAGKSGVYLNLAMLHMQRKDYSRARVSAMTSAELLPDNPLTRMGKAQAFGLAARCSLKLKDPSEAKRLAAKALKILGKQPGTEKLQEELLALTGEKLQAWQ